MIGRTTDTINRASKFPVIMIGEGLIVGGFAGLIVLLYRISLNYAGIWMNQVLNWIRGNPVRIFVWFFILVGMAFITGFLVKWEPMISGSGIPQLEGEMTGKLDQRWYRIIPAKFIGGFLGMFAGLALGREGPSIQLGAMAGKGVSRALKRGKTEEKFLLTCGASAGLSAAFHAPLAGVMFAMEEVHKNFSVVVFISAMTASVTADYITSSVLGMEPVFQFQIVGNLPSQYYWMLVILGVVLGLMGIFYNWFTLLSQSLYKRARLKHPITKAMIPFLLAGIVGLVVPQILGSGHAMIETLTDGQMVLSMIVVLFLLRFLFSGISFGSGVPGGIFFPMLVLGAYIGGVFGYICRDYLGLPAEYVNNFVLLAMAGFFTAVVRAPLTGIILIFELTGSLSQMLSLSVITIVSYIVSLLMGAEPIYESLLERILAANHISTEKGMGQKVLDYYAVAEESEVANHMIKEIIWPEHCLLVAINRGGKEIIPKGKTKLLMGDIIITMSDEEHNGDVFDAMSRLCRKHP